MEEQIARGRGTLPCLEELLKLDSEGASPPRGRVLLILGLDRCYTLTSAESRKGKGSGNRQECLRLQTPLHLSSALADIQIHFLLLWGLRADGEQPALCFLRALQDGFHNRGPGPLSPSAGRRPRHRASFGLPAFGVHMGRGQGQGQPHTGPSARPPAGAALPPPYLPLHPPCPARTVSARLPLEIYAPGRGLALFCFSPKRGVRQERVMSLLVNIFAALISSLENTEGR